jgi:hypothetical protein
MKASGNSRKRLPSRNLAQRLADAQKSTRAKFCTGCRANAFLIRVSIVEQNGSSSPFKESFPFLIHGSPAIF